MAKAAGRKRPREVAEEGLEYGPGVFVCMVTDCEYKCKQACTLRQHQANVHDMDVKWYHCDICEFKAKQASALRSHQAHVHDVGVKWHHCDICEYKAKQAGDLRKHQANVHKAGAGS